MVNRGDGGGDEQPMELDTGAKGAENFEGCTTTTLSSCYLIVQMTILSLSWTQVTMMVVSSAAISLTTTRTTTLTFMKMMSDAI